MAPFGSDRLSFPLLRQPTEETSKPGSVDVGGVADDLTLTEATELLDWLEGHGIVAREVEVNEAGLMTVRWG
jgi:hypothetical protein